ncbi:hypothetical protein ACFVVQ_00680 [Paenibacillus chitinolyticus]|uniref:hypothetical protein n=1 Tax=Paenibacillus chitinolyticus TaxID=79263 RepID=UPI0036DD3084
MVVTITGLLTFLLKILTDNIKSKWIWITLVLLGLPYCLKVIAPPAYKLFTISLVETVVIVQNNWTRLICFVILMTLAYAALRKSDLVFRRELKERYPEYQSYDSKDNRYILVRVVEERKYIDGKSNVRREISIKNNMETEIKCIKGKVIFFCDEIKVFEAPFEERNIAVNYGATVYNKLIDREEAGRWNEFYIHIETIEYYDIVEEQIKLYGLRFHPNFHFLFSRYNYRIFGIIPIRYELSWLMRQWRWKIKPWLIDYPRLPRIYVYGRYSLTLSQKMKCFFRRKLNQIIWLSFVIPICAFLYFSFSGFLVVSWELMLIWFELAYNFFNLIYR